MKKFITIGLPLLLLALVLAGCNNPAGDSGNQGGGSPPGAVSYEYIKGESTYKLTITQSPAKAAYTPVPGDTYVLIIITGDVTKTSSGTITGITTSVITLKPSNSEQTFTIQINGDTIIKISGTITLEGSGGTVKGPDTTSSGGGGGGGGGSGGGGGGGGGNGSGSGNGSGNGSGEVNTVNSIEELTAVLASLPPNTLQNPHVIALSTSNITGIAIALYNEPNKYVSLDLTGSKITTIPDLTFFIEDEGSSWSGGYYEKTCSTLTEIVIPDGVTRIGQGAFYRCLNLTRVGIPNSVTSIGNGAFRRCTSLTSIVIPNNVTTIEDTAFRMCTSLTSVTIPNSIKSIGKMAFLQCASLTNVNIPNSVTSIGEGAFSHCTRLTAINVDAASAAYSSQDGVLYNKSKNALLTYPAGKATSSYTITSSVASIEGSAFGGCTSLLSVSIPNSVVGIGNNAFQDCSSLTSVNIPDSVTSIGSGAFSRCDNLISVTIPSRITQICDSTFNDCTSLTSVVIPNSVTSIGEGAFLNCSSLTNVNIPNSVTSIGDNAFNGCSSLTSVTFEGMITSMNFASFAFDGDLREKFYATNPTNGTPGTYTRSSSSYTWTKL